MRVFDYDTHDGWVALNRYLIANPRKPVFCAETPTREWYCCWCMCGEWHRADDHGHQDCGAPAIRIGRVLIGNGNSRVALKGFCAEHLAAFAADEDDDVQSL